MSSESISIIKTVPFIIDKFVSTCDHASSSLKYTSALPIMLVALVFELKNAAISLAFVRGTKLVILWVWSIVPFVLTLINSASNVVLLLLLSLFELDAKTQSPLRSHATSLAMEYCIAREAAESFVTGDVLLLFIICGITIKLFISSLLVSVIVGISILFILPVNRNDDPFICDRFVSLA